MDDMSEENPVVPTEKEVSETQRNRAEEHKLRQEAAEIGARLKSEKEVSEIQRNRAEEHKLRQETAEIGARLKHRWLRIGLAGAVAGVTLFLFILNNFLPLLKQDLEVAVRERNLFEVAKKEREAELEKAEKTLGEAQKTLKDAQEDVVKLKAASDSKDHVLREQGEQLKVEMVKREQFVKQGQASVARLQLQLAKTEQEVRQRREAQNQTEQEKTKADQERAKAVQALTTTRQELEQISQKFEGLEPEKDESVRVVEEPSRCREFSVIQKSAFNIPGLEYTLQIGDMTDHKVRDLVVLKSGGARVGQFRSVEANKDLTIRDGEAELSITFLTIEVSNLIPGVREDSGLVRLCTDRWKGVA